MCLLPAPDLALARLAVSAAAPAASAPLPQGHPIRQGLRDDDDSSDEELFSRCRIMDHQPATEALRVRIRRKVPCRSPREHAFRELAQREVRQRQWRLGITSYEQYLQWEMVQVFQVEFDYEDGPFPAIHPFDCVACSGRDMPDRTACVFHQFAIAESQLLELWRRWDHRMYPINPIDLLGEDDTTDWEAPVGQVVYPADRWLVPGSSAYFDFLTPHHNASVLA